MKDFIEILGFVWQIYEKNYFSFLKAEIFSNILYSNGYLNVTPAIIHFSKQTTKTHFFLKKKKNAFLKK